MAMLALGIVGAGIGAAFGNPVLGWSIGTTLAGVLFPPRAGEQERGRVDDIRVSGSGYGTMIPITFGQVRVGGNVIWMDKITEQSTTQRVGGKGGGSRATIRNYSYFASFMMMLAEGPVTGVRRIWAEDKLIYDTEANPSTTYTIRAYLGDADQGQDPLIVQVKGGAQFVPAYRFRAALMFELLPLADWGNRIPMISAEIACGRPQGIPQPDIIAFWDFENGLQDSGPQHRTLVYTPAFTTVNFTEPKHDNHSVELYNSGFSENGALATYFFGDVPGLLGTAMTVGFWCKYSDLYAPNANNWDCGFFEMDLSGPTPDPGWGLYVNASSGSIHGPAGAGAFLQRPSGPTTWERKEVFQAVDFRQSDPFQLRPWIHVAFTFFAASGSTPGRLRLYVGFQLVQELAITDDTWHMGVAQHYVGLRDNFGIFHFDDVGMVNNELSREDLMLVWGD